MATSITQREKTRHCVPPVGIMKHILWNIFWQSINKSNQASRYNSHLMGSTVVKEHVKYYQRVIKQQNPDCGNTIEHH